jgi:N-acetylglutamate synthase-like GNAT family acetyltransferase
MTTPTQALQVRRATIEDLPQLMALWKAEGLPVQILEKRFNEFQVVQEGEKLIAALAMQVAGKDGLVHSEVFAHPEQADSQREKLWERLQTISANHGLYRVWSQMDAPFWKSTFQEPAENLKSKLPAKFANDKEGWRVLQLKDEEALNVSLDKEFALFREAEREEVNKLFRQARVLKILAVILGIAVFVLVVIWAVMFIQAQKRLKPMGGVAPEIRLVLSDHNP